MSVAARDGERKRFPLSATRTPRPRSRAPHPAPTRDDSLQSEGVVRTYADAWGYSLCMCTRMNYIMNDDTCFQFICTQVKYNVGMMLRMNLGM